jgi:hypothetical protein
MPNWNQLKLELSVPALIARDAVVASRLGIYRQAPEEDIENIESDMKACHATVCMQTGRNGKQAVTWEVTTRFEEV